MEKALAKGYPIDYRPTPTKWIVSHSFVCTLFQRSGWWDKHLVYDTVRWLLDKGSDVNIVDKYGWNTLMYTCSYSIQHIPQDIFTRIVRETKNLEQTATSIYLWSHMIKAPPQTTDLALAARKNLFQYSHEDKESCWENIKILIDAGADVDKLSYENTFPFEDNKKQCYKEFMAKILMYKEQVVQVQHQTPCYTWDYEL